MTRIRIKDTDKCIIKALLENGRLTYSELGRRCGVSRQVAYERVKKMTERGIIKNFSISLNPDVFGLSFHAYILIIAKPDESREELIDFLKKRKNVKRVQLLFGRFDLFLEVLFRNKDEARDFLKEIHSFEAVEKTETIIVYQTVKDKPEEIFLSYLSNFDRIED